MENNDVVPNPNVEGGAIAVDVPQMDMAMPMPPVDNGAQVVPEAQQPVTPAEQPVAPEAQQPVAPEVQQPVTPAEQPVAPEAQQPAVPNNNEEKKVPQGSEATKKKGIFDKLKDVDWKKADVKVLFSALSGGNEVVSDTATTFEINLVPSVKAEAIKAVKMRNLVLFICIIIVAIAGGVVAILGSIMAGQKITIGNQTKKIDTMSSKIKEFDGVSEYLTIQDQLNGIANIEENRKILSRVFPVLSVLLPSGQDSITISELNVNLAENTISFTGQADAGTAPYIDYRVLESFKKSASLVTYDYGYYVDKDGVEIPTRCIVENNSEGGTLMDEGAIYAYWLRGKAGCDKDIYERDSKVIEMLEEWEAAKAEEEAAAEEGSEEGENMSTVKTEEEILKEEQELYEKKKEIYEEYKSSVPENWYDKWLKENDLTRYDDDEVLMEKLDSAEAAYNAWYDSLNDEEKWVVGLEIEDGVSLKDVNIRKIWRTPQFSKWYKKGYIDLSGSISGVPHFASECVRYSGTEVDNTIRWIPEENQCKLLDEPIEISDSSNGRDSEGNLVLRFEASALINEDALLFKNKHVMAIGPNGKDVTDSYIQIEEMFSEEAKDCNSSDVICINNEENETGGEEENNAEEGGNSGE